MIKFDSVEEWKLPDAKLVQLKSKVMLLSIATL